MLTRLDLYNIARSRFDEAKILRDNKKPDGAVYLCGYSLELILKWKIIKTLNWDGYPDSNNDFKGLASFKIHDLDMLLKLSGIQKQLIADTQTYARWQIANAWNSEIRYKGIGSFSEADAKGIIEATKEVINFIIRS